MNCKPLILVLDTLLLLAIPTMSLAQQQVYKWTDPSGRVHYGQKKPESAEQIQTLDIAPAPPTSATNSDTETERLNALSEQMAKDREAEEQARQERALRSLQLENERLQNDLLSQQLEQQQQSAQQSDDTSTVIGYPSYSDDPSYPYYPSYPYPAVSPRPWPCQPWPGCRQVQSPEPPSRPQRPYQPYRPYQQPSARPNLPSNPAPAGFSAGSRPNRSFAPASEGVSPASKGVLWGR